MEDLLRQLEAVIGRMSPEDRIAAATALHTVVATIRKYKPKFTAPAIIKFVSLWGIAMGTDGIQGWTEKVKKRAKKVGPNVDSVFQAL